jgi:hypothetical protein
LAAAFRRSSAGVRRKVRGDAFDERGAGGSNFSGRVGLKERFDAINLSG